jgi:3-hydroxybutyryl-CoA dehydratase
VSPVPAAEFPSIAETITQETINDYADLSGDYNPLHVDEEAAAASEFGGTIAHGPIALQSFFRSLTGWLGAAAPPAGTEIKVTFRHPVRAGDTVTCELREREDGEPTEITAECFNQDATPVIAVRASVPG